ncbi:metal ABC transporter solute-binding protein, Zn/Mn family [Palleronia sp.]|uniref:metal ABC transporter solute-binding protein, Zn/Mn family n=1 Tax=Palleronia sp. TaxID=1940284 RepID=UPI0035C82089
MFRFAILPALVAAPVWAQPSVISDLPITAGLSTAVLGEPVPSLLEPGDDPHTASLRPSQARALGSADLVVRLGGGLTPWLDGPTENLAGLVLVLEAPEHDHEAHEDHRAEDEHDEHAHEEKGHDHAMHAWLDPEITAGWLDEIAATLGEVEPAGAETYRANAEHAAEVIRQAVSEAQARLQDNPPGAILTVHDAWGPAAEAFDLPLAGAISQGDATRPGVRHLSEVEARLEQGDVGCLLAAPGDDRSQAQRLSEAYDLPIVTLPLTGQDGAEGVGVYLALIEGIGGLSETCPAK